jgi:ABC-2 type transport system ATP-binding protein
VTGRRALPSPALPPAIELKELTKSFGAVTAVGGVSLSIRTGQVVALLGPNGAGKSTTIDMILGLQRPDTGTVLVHGRPPAEAAASGEVAAVLQEGGLLNDFTVTETLRYIASLYPDPVPIGDMLARAGLESIAGRRVGKCSGGEKQRLRFAVATIGRPRLLVLDEPTAGLDAAGRREFWRSVRDDVRGGRTVLLATHHLEEADAYAERIVVLDRGVVVADGTAAEIRNAVGGRRVRAEWPDGDDDALRALPGVQEVERSGSIVTVRTRDPDGVTRYMLGRTNARNVETISPGFEDAFLALTAPHAGLGERARSRR